MENKIQNTDNINLTNLFLKVYIEHNVILMSFYIYLIFAGQQQNV